MFKTFTKINNVNLTSGKQGSNKLNSPENKHPLNIHKYKKSSSHLTKTSSNFKSNLSLTPLYDELTNLNKVCKISKKNILYFNFNKAPSIKENHYAIYKLIRAKKNQRNKDLEKLHNKILINESESYRNKLYITSSDFNPNDKNNIIKSMSHRELPIKKKNIQKKINKTTRFQKTYTSVFNNNSAKKINATILKDKKILSVLTKDESEKEKETRFTFRTISKMRMNIYESLHNEFIPKKLVNLEEKLAKFKIIQNMQNKRVRNISLINDFIRQVYLRRLIYLKNYYQTIYDKYSKEMDLYLEFLNNTLNSSKEALHVINIDKFKISSQIEKLILKIIYKQSKLEYLVEIRNCLLKIKNTFDKDAKPQIYYDLLLMRDSKILIIGNFLESISFIKQINSRALSNFNHHLQYLKRMITNRNNNLDITEKLLNNLNLGNHQVTKIFSSPEEVIDLYEYLTDKDLGLLNQLQMSQREKNKIEQYYEENLMFYQKENNGEEAFKDVKKLSKLKKELIEKNELLKRKYLYYKDILKSKINQNQNAILKHKRELPAFFDFKINLDIINREKYFNEMKKYKYKGLLLLNKLINLIKNFLKLKYSKRFLETFPNRNRLYILDINTKSFSKDEVNNINKNILKAISIYENICKYVIFIHKELKQNKKNAEIIQEQMNIIGYNKKIQKAINEKNAQNQKVLEKNKQIYEKAMKPVLYIEKKINVENKVKEIKIKNERIKAEKKHLEEDEINGLIKYDGN